MFPRQQSTSTAPSELRFVYIHPYSFPGKRAHVIQTVETCRALAERGHEVFLLMAQVETESIGRSLLEIGVEAHPRFHLIAVPEVRLGRRKGLIELTSPFTLFWRLSGLIRRRRTVIYLRTLRDSRLCRFLLLASRLLRAPLIYEAHKVYTENFQDRDASDRQVQRILRRERRMLAGADGVVVSHPLLEPEVRRRFRPEKPLTTAPNGVRPRAPRGQRDRFDAVYSGSLYDWKGVDLCIEAAARVPACRLAVVGGNPPERLEELRTLAEKLAVQDRVSFLGQMTREQALTVVESARMALVPLAPEFTEGERYTCPLKMLEAMACGVPVIATDTPAVRSFIEDDVTGILVPPGDVEAMAAAIRRLTSSAETADRMARTSREAVSEYTYAVRAERLERFAGSLL